MGAVVELVGFPGFLPPTAPLGTRELGRRERARLQATLDARPAGAVVAVDLRRVELVNHAFSDECFAVLLERMRAGEHPGRFVVLVAPPEALADPLANVPIVLARRDLAVLCLREPEGVSPPDVAGQLSERLADTLRAVLPGDTNEALAEKLGIGLTACANRTAKLARMRLLRKGPRRKGALGYKQYEFAPVLPEAPLTGA